MCRYLGEVSLFFLCVSSHFCVCVSLLVRLEPHASHPRSPPDPNLLSRIFLIHHNNVVPCLFPGCMKSFGQKFQGTFTMLAIGEGGLHRGGLLTVLEFILHYLVPRV